MLVGAHYFDPPLKERIILAALAYSETRRMPDHNVLLGIAGIITAIGGLFTVFVKYRKGRAEIHDLKAKRNTELENYLFGRFQGELQRVDQRLAQCEERHERCEADHREALRKIAELKAKVEMIETTSGTYLKLKE